MTADAPNLNHRWARLLVDELRRQGAARFVIAPGSRSAPLALAAAACAPRDCTVHFDERGAAFHALGWARAAGRPAVVITTSGSAAANLWPAVVEAAAARIPLILLTADRPPELLDCGANQAIDQLKLFGDCVRWHCVLPCPTPEAPPEYVLSTAAHAAHRALGPPAGPVHIDCMYREPLAPIAAPMPAPTPALDAWTASGAPFAIRPAAPPAALDERVVAPLREAERGAIVVGQLHDAGGIAAARALAETLRWPLCTDIASGLRFGATLTTHVQYCDQLLLCDAFAAAFNPSLVLHLGGPIVSKRLAAHLAALRPECIVVDDHPFRQDPAHQASMHIAAGVGGFCRAAAAALRDAPPRRWGAEFAAWSGLAAQAIDAWTGAQRTLTEMGVARALTQLRPAGAALFAANSMPVRDLDMYADAAAPEGPVFANRGASGIDGNLAFAAGIAAASGRPAAALVGDLALLHDLNSLALLRGIAAPFALVAINNDGGGIFHFLPVADHAPPEAFETLFGAPHGIGFAAAAHMFGLRYALPGSMADFRAAFAEAIAAPGPTLIEVRTDRHENLRAHRALQAHVRETVAAALRAAGP